MSGVFPSVLMYKRLYTFLNKNIIYDLQFGFRQQYHTSHALIMKPEKMKSLSVAENEI